MSSTAPDRETFEAIEAYVLDRMPAEERAAFERRLAADPELRAEMELERDQILAVELGGVRRVLAALGHEEPGRGGGRAPWSLLKYAAGIALLLAGTLWWFLRPPVNERLFAEHFTADPGLPVAMSATNDPVFADAMVSYKEGRYAKARAQWAPLLQREPQNDTLRYYTASTFLAEGDPEAAIPLLEPLATTDSTAFVHKARWYLFLAYIRTGAVDKAMALPVEKDPVRGERARSIKQRLCAR